MKCEEQTMQSLLRIFLVATAVSLVASVTAYSQIRVNTDTRSSLGFRAGYGFTGGDWTKSRVAPIIQQFGSGVSFEGDLSIPLAPRWALMLGGGYTYLDGSKWEQFAYLKGDAVTMSASITQLSLLMRPYLFSSPAENLSFEFGLVGTFENGSEVVDGQYYEYDFFNSFRIGGQVALEYDKLLSQDFAFTLRAGAVVIPNGLNYADGESRTITYFPVTAGIRVLF